MKRNTLLLVVGTAICIMGCGVPQSRYDRVVTENEDLRATVEKQAELLKTSLTEIEKLKYGEARLISLAKKAYLVKDYSKVISSIRLLSEKHPTAFQNEDLKTLLAKIEVEHNNELKPFSDDHKTGIWEVKRMPDDHCVSTREDYLSTAQVLKGEFSNSVTDNSELNISFMIKDASDISFKLFEYAGDRPIKVYAKEKYRVVVKDEDGNTYKLTANHYLEKLSFDKESALIMHKLLVKGGKLNFKLTNLQFKTSKYHFCINDASYYENVYIKLLKS